MKRFITRRAGAYRHARRRVAASDLDHRQRHVHQPVVYDEFSDPDMIRVGDDFYMTGTTMHAMPGLPILHSKDMVNWDFVGYALDTLDLGPAYRLEDGKSIYGQGIWAPSFRYHYGTFYIFSNVNHAMTRDAMSMWRASGSRERYRQPPRSHFITCARMRP